MALQAIAGLLLLFTTSCSKDKKQLQVENVMLIEGAELQSKTKRSLAQQIADVYHDEIYLKRLYMPALNFKGVSHEIKIGYNGSTPNRSMTISFTTLTNPQVMGKHQSFNSGLISAKHAIESYFFQVAALESVSIEWLTELLDHLNQIKNDLPKKVLVTKQDYADEITRVLYHDIFMKNIPLEVFPFKGKKHQCKYSVTGKTKYAYNSRLSTVTFSFTTLTNPRVQGRGTVSYDLNFFRANSLSDKNAMDLAVQRYFNQVAAQVETTTDWMKDVLNTLHALKYVSDGFSQSK